jgi:hypothetical protein
MAILPITAVFNCPLLEKLIFLQPVKESLEIYGNRRFITAFKKAHLLFLS